MRSRTFQLLYSYLCEFLAYAGWRAVGAATLLFLSGLFQGISLLMLIPLLGLAGLGTTSATTDGVSTAVQGLLDGLHISYNLVGVLAVFLLVIAMEAVFTRYRSVALHVLQLEFVNHLRNALYRMIGSASWQFHSRNHSSESMHLLDNAVNKIGAGTYYALQLFVLAFQALVYLFVASSLSLPMTLVMLVTGLALYALVIPVNREVFQHGEKLAQTSRSLYRNMVDFFGGLKLAKSYNRTQQHVDQFERTGQQLLHDEKAVVAASASARMWLRIVTVSLLCIFVYVALGMMNMGIERLLVMIVVVNRLYGVFSSAQNNWQGLLQMLPSFDAYRQALQRFKDHAESPRERKVVIPPLRSSLRLENISFCYPDSYEEPVFSGFSVAFPANKTTAITGESGSGKSTLVDILMGLLVPDSGEIYVDDMLLSAELLYSWRHHAAYVPQEAYLFDGSIRSNLQWVNDDDYDDAQLWAALDSAAAGEFVRNLPDKLDSRVGERGGNLSGGERQRIALARALLKKPDLLILDEATSALDRANEERILEALDKLHGQMTIIIIAHRHSMVERADCVVALDDSTAEPGKLSLNKGYGHEV